MILLLLACTSRPELVVLSGTIFESGSEDSVVADAQVRVLDFALEEVDAVAADSEGAFAAQARFGSYVFLDLSADGYARTGFTGTVGMTDYAIPDGVLWMRTESELDALKSSFEGCPLLEQGGAVEGEILMALPQDGVMMKTFVETGWARVVSEDGEEVEACYLDEDGLYDPEAVYTGPTGRFLIPNVSGKVQLWVGYDLGETPMYESYSTVFVPDGGVSSLYDSLWMPLPS